jgi:hypothetical protein
LCVIIAGLLTIKLVSSTGEQASGILIAAAAPVTLLTALSKSSLGKQVQEGLNEKLPQLEAEAAALKQQHTGGLQIASVEHGSLFHSCFVPQLQEIV